MKLWCCDTYPDNVRYSIAGFLGNNWQRLVHDREPTDENTVGSNAFLFWSMIVILLQDVEESVRDRMCKSIAPLLHQTSQSGIIQYNH